VSWTAKRNRVIVFQVLQGVQHVKCDLHSSVAKIITVPSACAHKVSLGIKLQQLSTELLSDIC